jgi:ubiquinone/menaquinone biosynthesis C-methylase UbiE/superfamily II DNA or RNA helicase
MPNLRPYQLEAVKAILEKKRILIADGMGLGKTAESIAAKRAIENRQKRKVGTLISCPASVAQHWVDEIKIWYPGESKVTRVQTSNLDADIETAKGSDFTIIGYPTLSRIGEDSNRLARLNELGFEHGIVDEGHNTKNPESLRSMATRNLFHPVEYLSILSGTPIPNGLVDIYTLLNLLDPKVFPIEDDKEAKILAEFYRMFKQDPGFIRTILEDRRLMRTVEDGYLTGNFPDLREHNLEVRLENEHEDVYRYVYENDDIKPGSKIWQLIKASINPNLVDPRFLPPHLAREIGRMRSSVYNKLDEKLEKITSEGGKVLIFTDLREGVTRELRARYSNLGALVIDGEISAEQEARDVSLREETRRKFQRNPDHKVLIATTVMDEGVDLTAATAEIHLTLNYVPATMDQRVRRAQRIGEVGKSHLDSYVVRPHLGTPLRLITDGIASLLDDKRKIIEYLYKDPLSITKEDLDEIKNGNLHRSKHMSPVVTSPANRIYTHFGSMKGLGHKKIRDHYVKNQEEARDLANLYKEHWDGYYGGNTGTLVQKVVKALERNEKLERKLDLASGPFSLSRRINEPVVNLDVNEHMLKAGEKLEDEGTVVQRNSSIQAYMHQLPFAGNNFDLVNCSLALHTSEVKGKDELKEREQTLREMNRVLRKDGYALVTLPYTVIDERNTPTFYEGLRKLGFEVMPFSGFYIGPKDSNFEVYLLGLKKTGKPQEESLNNELVWWKMDDETTKRRGFTENSKGKGIYTKKKSTKKEVVDEFYSKEGLNLEDCV